MTQTIRVILNEDTAKKDIMSKDNFLKINLFIEIFILINIQQYLLNIQKNELKSKFYKQNIKSQGSK